MIFEYLPESYAKALLELTSGQENEIIEYLDTILNIVFQDQEIKNFFLNPAINRSYKIQTIKKIFSSEMPEILVNFLCVLANKERLDLLPIINEIYKYYYDQKNNILPIKVITAFEIDTDYKKYIQSVLDQYFNKKTDITFVVRPQIIGGIIIQAEGKEIDNSILTKLKLLNKNLNVTVQFGVGYED